MMPDSDDGTTITHALTIDVEDYFQVGVFQDRIDESEWERHPSRVERNLELIAEILADRSLRATFFVLGWIAERHPAAIRRLADAGHEIGSHGYGHRPITNLSREQLREDLRRAQGVIGDCVGRPPTSYRAPCFSVTGETLWALEEIHAAGIRDDSSIFPVNHPEYGIPDAERDIHVIELESGGSLREFPMTSGRVLGRRVAVCGGGWFRLFPYAVTRRALRAHEGTGRPFIFYLHPWELDPDQPRLHDRASAFGRFRHYVNLKRTQDRFRRLLDDFRFTTMGAVLDDVERKGELPRVRSNGSSLSPTRRSSVTDPADSVVVPGDRES